MHEVLVNRLGGLSLPRKRVVRLTDRPDMTLDVYSGRKTTMQCKKNRYFGIVSLPISILVKGDNPVIFSTGTSEQEGNYTPALATTTFIWFQQKETDRKPDPYIASCLRQARQVDKYAGE